MMRKIISIFLLITLTLSLAGCANKAKEVEEKIATLTADVTADSYTSLVEIEEEYRALDADDKEKVTNHDALIKS